MRIDIRRWREHPIAGHPATKFDMTLRPANEKGVYQLNWRNDSLPSDQTRSGYFYLITHFDDRPLTWLSYNVWRAIPGDVPKYLYTAPHFEP